ncbi:MAG: hypothetical protein LBK60_09855 [Verrucomicrobiales bacterium]|jgi:type II secretory pathway pseudopilin PulG|nr:hypothetical protein [Verrucomicrobiales bacterium]
MKPRPAPPGFSLIELVLALGILAYVLVAILMLFPLALDTAADSKNETRATFIAQNLLAELQALPDDLNPVRRVFLTTAPGAPAAAVSLDLSADREPCYLAFNANGETLGVLTAGDYLQAANLPPGTVFLGSVNAAPVAGPGAYRNSRVTLTVEYPPIPGPAPQRRRQTFIAFLMYQEKS